MRAPNMTDEQVEEEIERLKASEDVRLAIRYRQYQARRRQYMYSLRAMEKQGKAMREQGITLENFRDQEEEIDA